MIFIRELKVEATIGVKAWERQVKQQLRLDLEYAYAMQPAVTHDELCYAVDYFAVSEASISFIQSRSFCLIEALASALAEHLLDAFTLQWIKLKVVKPGTLAEAKEVGVIVEKHR